MERSGVDLNGLQIVQWNGLNRFEWRMEEKAE